MLLFAPGSCHPAICHLLLPKQTSTDNAVKDQRKGDRRGRTRQCSTQPLHIARRILPRFAFALRFAVLEDSAKGRFDETRPGVAYFFRVDRVARLRRSRQGSMLFHGWPSGSQPFGMPVTPGHSLSCGKPPMHYPSAEAILTVLPTSPAARNARSRGDTQESNN